LGAVVPIASISMLTAAIIVVHVIVCFALVLLILLHSGRGGGLSDMFGGGMGASAAGSTVMERNLDRVTVMVAILFMFTSITLVIRLQ
jgi:preprotein translocase subunit SecG